MARPPLPIGTYGEIKVRQAEGGSFVARAKFRDYDGVTRPVEKRGNTEAQAKNNLLEALRDRRDPVRGEDVTAESTVTDVGPLWLAEVRAQVELGELSPNTYELYERQYRNHVVPALSAVKMRELLVPCADRFLQRVRVNNSAAGTKTIRTVASGIAAFAVRRGALRSNPFRETRSIKGKDKRPPRALRAEERDQWITQLEADKQAVRKDLPDLTRWMLATGVRIGEALAVSWDEIDLEESTVDIEWTIIRVRGEGLCRVHATKTDGGERTLPLPRFAVQMLRRRLETRGDVYPVFPDSRGGWRDPSNTRRDLRNARGTEGFAWVTSHTFRKTCATILDDAKLSARNIADVMGHSRPSMTQDVYMGRKAVDPAVAHALDEAMGTQSNGD